jgi:hypothetical protein
VQKEMENLQIKQTINTLSMEQGVVVPQLQPEQQKETLQRQFLEESQAMQENLFNTRQHLEEVETWV